jgi:Uma2 family endonuclease
MFTKYDEEKDKYSKVEEPDASYGYSYADYLKWEFLERLELIRGRIFKLGAPNYPHSVISRNLFVPLANHLGRACHVFTAPFDVRLPKKDKTNDSEITTVVQPDIGVICDQRKIDNRGCCGAPDLLVEILSPSNRDHDLRTKFALYEEACVPEYWIIDAENEKLMVYVMNSESKYGEGKTYVNGDIITSVAIKGFSVKVIDIFEELNWN